MRLPSVVVTDEGRDRTPDDRFWRLWWFVIVVLFVLAAVGKVLS